MITPAPTISRDKIILVAAGFVVINLLLLDIVTIYNMLNQKKSILPVVIQSTYQHFVNSNATPSAAPLASVADCPNCSQRIDNAVTAIKQLQLALIASGAAKLTPTTIPSATLTPTPVPSSGSIKEIYVPLGSGTSTATDWTDVSGLQANIDTTLYPSIKTVTFEVGGHTPTGNQNVYVRLYNGTDGHPVISSDLTWNGGASQFLVSPAVTLDGGQKLYKVQMKTQLGYLTYIDSAKVHIILY